MSAKSANKHDDLGETTVVDMINKSEIKYPITSHSTMAYDFHFTKDGVWHYINSADDLQSPVWASQSRTVQSKGESWRIVDVKRNTIVKQHKAKKK